MGSWETWSEAANRRLRLFLMQGKSDGELAYLLQRPVMVVRAQIARLGIKRAQRPEIDCIVNG